uniref:Putative secreted protein n=1 Tax=Anopheles darlingi TaxID=43151 RepID=A0A2M4DAK0_ANODA
MICDYVWIMMLLLLLIIRSCVSVAHLSRAYFLAAGCLKNGRIYKRTKVLLRCNQSKHAVWTIANAKKGLMDDVSRWHQGTRQYRVQIMRSKYLTPTPLAMTQP